MKILHLCSYYTGSKVYKHLFQCLSQHKEIEKQEVFIPIRDKKLASSNIFSNKKVSFYYTNCLNVFTRALLSFKVLKLIYAFFSFKKKHSGLRECTLTHAHTLYSDGILAYILYKLYRTPYVITIRGTDVNLADKVYLHWRPIIKVVLKNAKCVVFISPKHQKFIEAKYHRIIQKTLLIPNGISNYWINHAISSNPDAATDGMVKGIYIGAINKNKNVQRMIKAFFSAETGTEKKLTLIGGTHKDYVKIFGEIDQDFQNRIVFRGLIGNKDIIKQDLLLSDIFIMPSHSETFGLAYIEAISQAVPIVYSHNQGVDGYFPEATVGFACNPRDPESIKGAIEKALRTFPRGLDFREKSINPAVGFSWENVTKKLINEAY